MTDDQHLQQLALDNCNSVYEITCQLEELRVIKDSLVQIAGSVDQILQTAPGLDPRTSRYALEEVRDNLMLIDLSFNPVLSEMKHVSNQLQLSATKLCEHTSKCQTIGSTPRHF